MAEPYSHSCVSFTADGVAYRRTFTDIPLSKEIFAILQMIQGPIDPEELERIKIPEIVPFFEARYKIIDLLLNQAGIKHVFELAAGLSPRGILKASHDPAVKYLEVDLPEKAKLKAEIISELMYGKKIGYGNIFIRQGNVINPDVFKMATRLFNLHPHERVVVINEGLLRYFTFEERTILATHILDFLKIFGGVWITPDITRQEGMPPHIAKAVEINKAIEKKIGRSLTEQQFKSEEQARSFFENLGLRVKSYPFELVHDLLSSPKILGLSADSVEKTLSGRVVFVMSPA